MEHKHHGPISVIIILFVIIISTAFIIKGEGNGNSNENKPGNNNPPIAITPAYKCGLTANTPLPNSTVAFPLSISGVIDNAAATDSCTWVLFEGYGGMVSISDGVNTYASGPVLIAGDWMNNLPHNFSATLSPVASIPSGTPLTITFTEEDPSGQGLIDVLSYSVIAQ